MESFVLKWNAFQENVSSSFSKLRKEEDFFDVTLVTEDAKLLNAHKVVLSAASDFFKTVLRRADHVKPLIYLHGVGSSQLVHIMDYIYEGEIKIQQRNLNKFLEVAQKLKIAGLLCEYNEPQQDFFIGESEQPEPINASEEREMGNDYDLDELVSAGDIEDNLLMSSSSDKENQRPKSLIEIKEAVDKIVWKIEANHWMCKVCKQSFKESNTLRRHAQIHIDGISLTCDECGKILKTSSQLNVHKYKKHGKGKFWKRKY